MKAHLVSKDNKVSLDEKIKTLETYSTGDLLYVLREFEDCPRRFEDDVVKKLGSLLYAKGIICM